jgi:DNA-binding NarL/FixJ family response regulator
MHRFDAVLIADADAESRAELARVLECEGYRVVHASSGLDALECARMSPPVAAILEIPLGSLSGYEVCRSLKAELGHDLPVIFLSGARTESYDRVAGLLVGADDYVIKPYAPDEVLARLRHLLHRAHAAPGAMTSRLTRREYEVLCLMGDGLRREEIATRLFISAKTVATHIESILRKLRARSTAQAVAVAYREEILHPALTRRA